jgi:hypothetical protein
MLGIEMLEVTIGLILVYLVLSLIGTSVGEAVGQLLQLRGRNLRDAIRVLLEENDTLLNAVYQHPTIKALRKSDKRDPSYIPPAVFSRAVLDIVTHKEWRRSGSIPGLLRERIATFSVPVHQGEGVQTEPVPISEGVRETLLGFVDEVQGDVDLLLGRIEKWFDDTTDRASGWFRRRLNVVLVIVGFVIALFCNADTLQIFQRLAHDQGLRQQAVELVTQRLRQPASPAVETQPAASETVPPDAKPVASKEVMTQIKEAFGDIQPFLGWSAQDPVVRAWADGSFWGVVGSLTMKVLGLLVTAFAVSLGAPFWFDLLQKLVRIRTSVRPSATPSAPSPTPSTVLLQPATGVADSATASAVPSASASAARLVVAQESGYRSGLPGFVPFAGSFQLANAYWLARAAQLAYQDEADIHTTCRAWGLESRFIADLTTDTQLFVAADDQIVLISFRGTEPRQLMDIMTDVKYKLVAPDWWSTADDPAAAHTRVHEGFNGALKGIWSRLRSELQALHTQQQAVWLTGHSLGGALAALAAYRLWYEIDTENQAVRQQIAALDQQLSTSPIGDARLKLLGERAAAVQKRRGSIYGVYTIGQPRCGDRGFVETMTQRLPNRIVRTINNRDIVPRVPLRAMGYSHLGHVYYFDEFGRLHQDPGLWYRLLDTVLVSLDDLKSKGLETVQDHNAAAYVGLLQRVSGVAAATA